MKKIAQLSRREREVMDLVFAQGEATLSQILEGMEKAPTRAALRSILTILEGKGQLKHRQEGREFILQPVHSRVEVGQSTLSRVIGTFFGGSLTQALAAYLSAPGTKLSDDEVAELREFLDKTKTDKRPKKS
ncbi:MAG: BlaI/MecI/CopY family transcriptional regulator [Verrucomicrobia bacterium]|nr:BlaI/MecI/CopY family transcriptional regulator [Verrucomicrobiota bacterium]